MALATGPNDAEEEEEEEEEITYKFSLQHLSASIDAILSKFSHNVVSTQHIQMVILCKQRQNNYELLYYLFV